MRWYLSQWVGPYRLVTLCQHCLFHCVVDSRFYDYFPPTFSQILAAGLSGLYSSLPKKLVPRHELPTSRDADSPGGPVTLTSAALFEPVSSAPCVVELPVGGPSWHQLAENEWNQSTDLRRFLHTLDFCNLVVKVPSPCFFFIMIIVASDSSTHRRECTRPGPLLSITISENIFEKLLLWVEGPPSQLNELLFRIRDQQRVHLLSLFETLMTQSRQDVVSEISILRPLLQFLFKLSSQLRPVYSRVYGRTLYELCVLLCRDSFFLDHCRKICHQNVRDRLLHFIYSGFLVPVLGSALHQSALDEVVAATAYLELFLRRLTEPALIKLVLSFIVNGTYDSYSILSSLINRLNSKAALVTDVMHQ
ncbi:hypothetical protein FGIG_13988, partial [Fasciola gigantica]